MADEPLDLRNLTGLTPVSWDEAPEPTPLANLDAVAQQARKHGRPLLDPTLAGLLRAICENPADDEVRLVVADWYEENGEEAYASFIRCQIGIEEVADLECGPCVARRHGQQHSNGPCRCHRRMRALRRREREILDAADPEDELPHRIRWLPFDVPSYTLESMFQPVFRRGFPASVSCALADWCGRECESCGGSGEVGVHEQCARSGRWRICRCPDCRSTGRVNAHGPAIVQAAPIERVTLTDQEPYRAHDGVWLWRCVSNVHGNRQSTLPVFLFDHLPCLLTKHLAEYSARQAALDALCHAARDWARQQAGLPALS